MNGLVGGLHKGLRCLWTMSHTRTIGYSLVPAFRNMTLSKGTSIQTEHTHELYMLDVGMSCASTYGIHAAATFLRYCG